MVTFGPDSFAGDGLSGPGRKTNDQEMEGDGENRPGAYKNAGGFRDASISDIRASVAHKREPTNFRSFRQSVVPKRAIDLETGKSFLALPQHLPKGGLFHHKVALLGADGTLKVDSPSADALDDDAFFATFRSEFDDIVDASRFQISGDDSMDEGVDLGAENQVPFLGTLWRSQLKTIILLANDDVNAVMFTRGLQIEMPFLTGYEAYLLNLVVGAFDSGNKKVLEKVLTNAFRNRNVSRILVNNMTRFDILWHWSFQAKHIRLLDAWNRAPFVGFGGLPATENFPATGSHVITSIGRVILGEGTWWTRLITGREGLVTDDEKAAAQNLASETNGFEAANRSQFGATFGRKHVNEFRTVQRLSTDESVVRTFNTTPVTTLTNNGVEHVLRAVAKHWHNILYQPSGNFAHQRMEVLDPVETMRFHMPLVIMHLVNLRGLSRWDSEVLAPFVSRLQNIRPMSDLKPLIDLIEEFRSDIVQNICGGIPSRAEPLLDWLDAITGAVLALKEEASELVGLLLSVDLGINLGYQVVGKTSWDVPSDAVLAKAILAILKHDMATDGIAPTTVKRALNTLTPKDKRTLASLVEEGYGKSKPATLLLSRAVTLLQRELRRDAVAHEIRELSRGNIIEGEQEMKKLKMGWLYIIDNGDDNLGRVYKYAGRVKARMKSHLFIDQLSGNERVFGEGQAILRRYIPVAESITRAQKAFMQIELKHGKKFSYNAFMEISELRLGLRKLLVIAQLQCQELDDARLNTLKTIQEGTLTQISAKDLKDGTQYFKFDGVTYTPFFPEDEDMESLARTLIVKTPPQNVIVIGGGPTGLTTTIHNVETALVTGGTVTLNEARDAFVQGGSSFERAQIVRLDSRWIAMLRYHLGTIYENVWIPASGETDAHLGNTLSNQGFIEITIKDLEDSLQIEISRLASKGLLQQNTQAKMQYDPTQNLIFKEGKALREGDLVQRKVDPNMKDCEESYTWKVTEIEYSEPLPIEKIELNQTYELYDKARKKLVTCQCQAIDWTDNTFKFVPVVRNNYKVLTEVKKEESIVAKAAFFPSVYPKGTKVHGGARFLSMECVVKNSSWKNSVDTFDYEDIANVKFPIDVANTHIVESIGKPHGSKVHACMTSSEPHGVCCIGGLKISMGMHNFGNRRWGNGIVDDIRSHTDQNTRVIGDFTKNVKTDKTCIQMLKYWTDKKDADWRLHFEKLGADSGYADAIAGDPIIPKMHKCLAELAEMSPNFRREYLQTRFFETGDNYYLGMEFPREYETWKAKTISSLTQLALVINTDQKKRNFGRFKRILNNAIDRLWFAACLEVIRTGDVYNAGASKKVPILYTIDSLRNVRLGTLPVGEAFRIASNPKKRWEVLIVKPVGKTIVRDVEGNVMPLAKDTMVRRGGNLARAPDGDRQSAVALAGFPVAHYVNYRTLRLNNDKKGYIYAFVGDEQSTPHFMRYSGLTGACINAMLFNEFIDRSLKGFTFEDRIKQYAEETNWCNGEVVQRGTGFNYGEDGFLRPGMTYAHALDYLSSKVIEFSETNQEGLSRDWKIKFAATFVPRGFENNLLFLHAMKKQILIEIANRVRDDVASDKTLGSDVTSFAMSAKKEGTMFATPLEFGQMLESAVDTISAEDKEAVDSYVEATAAVEALVDSVIDYSQVDAEVDNRISGQLFRQPKPVDSVIDDFAVEAQGFANSLTLSATLVATAVSWRILDVIPNLGTALISLLTPVIAFGTISNGSRYKSRNEEFRVQWHDDRLLPVMMDVYSCLTPSEMKEISAEMNPFIMVLDKKVNTFRESLIYYDEPICEDFFANYKKLKRPNNINSPSYVKSLKVLIAGVLVPVEYQQNSYIQEELLGIYKTLDDMEFLLGQGGMKMASEDGAEVMADAFYLYHNLLEFKGRLDRSLQRGIIKFGFLKIRSPLQSHAAAVFTYFYDKLCKLLCLHRTGTLSSWKPMTINTLVIKADMDRLAATINDGGIRRRQLEVRQLYHATHESLVTSVVTTLAYITFFSSYVFAVGNFGLIAGRDRGFAFIVYIGAFFTGIFATIGAILSAYYLMRKLRHLLTLGIRLLQASSTSADSDERHAILQVRIAIWTQAIATVARVIASLAAAVSLPWFLAESVIARRESVSMMDTLMMITTTMDGNGSPSQFAPPTIIALASLILQTLSTIFLLFVEYSLRYNFSPRMGEFVTRAFVDELVWLYDEMSIARNDIEPLRVQEDETWEFVAREFLHRYRFDTVLQADRYGSILGCIQSGGVQIPVEEGGEDDMSSDRSSDDILEGNEYLTQSLRAMGTVPVERSL